MFFTFASRIAVLGVREWYTKDYEKGGIYETYNDYTDMLYYFDFFQYGIDVKVVNSMRVSSSDGNTEHITIIANKIFIMDKDSFTEYLINRRIDNSFKEIRFVDAFPKELEIDVYTNWFTWKIKQKNFLIFSYFEDSKHFIFDIQ